MTFSSSVADSKVSLLWHLLSIEIAKVFSVVCFLCFVPFCGTGDEGTPVDKTYGQMYDPNGDQQWL